MATIQEVAKAAGVSTATVSRVFNGQSVSPAREKLVRQTAARLNFTPNRTARSLRRRHSDVIALIIPDIENPFFTALARGVEDHAQRAGYSVVLCNSDELVSKESEYVKIAAADNMAGIIVVPVGDDPALQTYIGSGRPVVAVDRLPGVEIDTVVVDGVGAGRSATEALLDAGHTRIACITGPDGVLSADQRLEGWRAALRERDLDPAQELVRHGDFRTDSGRAAMFELLDAAEPDAVVVANNLMGIGAFQALVSRRRQPPETGFAIIGDLPFTTMVSTDIVRVELPARRLGETAAELLIDRISGAEDPPRTVELASRLLPSDGSWPTAWPPT